jgi:zinc transport system substrate-binding protein
VLTSFSPVYCFTVNVAGNLAELDNLLPAHVEPHDYQFSRKELEKLSQADLVVLNGLGLETWLREPLANARRTSPKAVVEISAGLESDIICSNGIVNPHIWLDPNLAARAVTNILRALQSADPSNASDYAANAAAYIGRLQRLDRDLQQVLAPVRGAAVVTYHDAFPYFARRYGLNVVGVVEPVPEVEPSLKYLAGLYRSIRGHRAKAIFTEPFSASRLVNQIGCDLHLSVSQLDTLEAGALKADTYEQGMRNNGAVLAKYLTADAQNIPP